MNKKNLIIVTTILSLVGLITLTFGVLKSNNDKRKLVAQQGTDNIQSTSNKFNDVVLTISGQSDIIPYTMEDINQEECYVVLGKLKSIDGATNYNPAKKVFTEIMSYGTLEITEVIKGNLNEKTIPILKSGGKISLAEYEKGLTEPQKQKQSMQQLLSKSASEKTTEFVEAKDLDTIDVELEKEYLCVLFYNVDYERYSLDTFPDVFREVKRENGQIYLMDNETGKYELFTKIEDIIK